MIRFKLLPGWSSNPTKPGYFPYRLLTGSGLVTATTARIWTKEAEEPHGKELGRTSFSFQPPWAPSTGLSHGITTAKAQCQPLSLHPKGLWLHSLCQHYLSQVLMIQWDLVQQRNALLCLRAALPNWWATAGASSQWYVDPLNSQICFQLHGLWSPTISDLLFMLS